jgi:segregation and condensation protein B
VGLIYPLEIFSEKIDFWMMETQELKRIVEALIFAADGPLSAERILETLDPQNGFELDVVIDELNREYQESGRAFTIRQVAGGYQIVTQPNYASWIKKLYLGRQKTRLSQAALETLALIAFKQPISRVEIGQIRGVNSDGVIGTLLERKLITISGRSEGVGRPLLYSTTPDFLKYFGLNDLADLPKPREIEELFGKEGMPEELLHALSQEDPQLSLPINVEAEPDAAPDASDNKATAAKTLQPATFQAPSIPAEDDALNEPATDEVSEPAAPSDDPAEQSPASETEVEVVPIDINEKVVALLDDFEASTPSSDDNDSMNGDPKLQASSDEIAVTTVDLDSDFSALPDPTAKSESSLAILSLIPSAPQTHHQEVLPETLAAGVHELYKTSSEPPPEDPPIVEVPAVREINGLPAIPSLALDNASPSHFSPARDDHFAETNEIVVIDELLGLPAMRTKEPQTVTPLHGANFENTTEIFLATLESINDENVANHFDEENPVAALKSDSVNEVDGWLAEEFSREEIVEPDFFLKTDERLLDDLRKMPANPAQTAALNGATAAGTNHKSEASPVIVESPSLDEIFLEVNAKSTDLENETAITEINSTTEASLDALSLALPDFPELSNIEAPIPEPVAATPPGPVETPSEIKPEESPPAQSVSTAIVEVTEGAAASAYAQTELVNLPETMPESSTAKSEALWLLSPEANAEFELDAPAEVSTLAENEANLLLQNEAQALPLDTREALEKSGSRWTVLRERAAGWIKRAFAKLMTMVGVRSA